VDTELTDFLKGSGASQLTIRHESDRRLFSADAQLQGNILANIARDQ